jgi:hypothetical protein
MRGSLAIWCTTEQTEGSGHLPEIELHFNIWSGLPGSTPDVLDIGFLFKRPRTMQQLFLYVPGKVERSQLKDLSGILKDRTSLSAVFNDTLDVGRDDENAFDVLRGTDVAYRVIKVDIDNPDQVSINHLTEDDGRRTGTVIALGPPVVGRLSDATDHYIRLRIVLSGELKELLVSRIPPSDRVFLSSFYETRVIEFRVNEKRNYSEALRKHQKDGRPPTISRVHYFLVRDLSVEMLRAHATFRKMRRLEPGLWDGYLADLGSPNPENMIIYHWREDAKDGRGIEDFIALAAFREPGRNIPVFILAIVLLGVIGNATQTLLTSVISPIFGGSFSGSSVLSQSVIILLALLGLLALYYVSASPEARRRIKDFKTMIWQKLRVVIQRDRR